MPGSAPIHVQAHAPHRPKKLQQTVPKIEVIAATWLGRMMFALIIPRLSKAITIHGGKACCVRHGLTIISNGPIRQPRRVQKICSPCTLGSIIANRKKRMAKIPRMLASVNRIGRALLSIVVILLAESGREAPGQQYGSAAAAYCPRLADAAAVGWAA